MSAFQAAQMYSLQDANIFNIAVRGVFDDCQDIVKAISGDFAFKARHRIGAVNSINWARVAAQVVYYFKAYFAVGGKCPSPCPRAISAISTPGTSRAAWTSHQKAYRRDQREQRARRVLPHRRYRVRKAAEVKATSSPSMDISKSSNFERYVYDLVGRDPFRLKSLWTELDANGVFALAGTEIFRHVADTGFVSGSSTHADRLATIRRMSKDYGVMIDPHTADASRSGWSTARRTCRSSAWRPPSPRSSPKPYAKRSGASLRGLPGSKISKNCRSESK